MIEFILNGKTKKKSNIYKDLMEMPEKFVLTMEVENSDEIVVRVKRKDDYKSRNNQLL